MRTIITFDELYNAVGELAKEYDENYWQVEIQKCSIGLNYINLGGTLTKTSGVVFRGYINGFNKWIHGLSINEVIAGLRAIKNPPFEIETNIEVEIELPQEDTANQTTRTNQ